MNKANNPEQQPASTQLNLMSALREENLVSDKGSLFGMSDKQGTRFTG